MWLMECAGIKRIEELLTCGICYEYMDTTVVTSCSHNYCSLCIRKYLHYKRQCPTCYEETFEKDLRKNKVLDEIIEQYLNMKEQLEKKVHGQKTPSTRYKNSKPVCSPSSHDYETKQDASDANEVLNESSDSPVLGAGTPSTPCGRRAYQQDASTPSTSSELRIPSMFTPKRKKGFRNEENCQVVTCPVCKVDVPQSNINKHLDDCLKREHAKEPSQEIKPKRKPLPKLVLSLMKDNVIRKKLKELGLSSQGDRKALENRLQKYTVLYNAECDKANPRPVSELIKQCEEEESLERKVQKPSNRLNINKNTEPNIIEHERKKYLADNKDSFNHLIAKIKRSDSPPKLPVRRNILSRKTSEISRITLFAKNGSGEKSDFLPLEFDNPHIDESDFNASCSSSEHPMNFLRVELSSSSNDSNQCAFNNTLNPSCKISPLSRDTAVKNEIVETDERLEDASTHTEVSSSYWSSECKVSEDRLNNDCKESLSELIRSECENSEKIVSSAKRCKNDANSPEEHVKYSESEAKWQDKSRDDDLIVEDTDSDDVQSVSGKSRLERVLHASEKETYESSGTRFEKENFDSSDENKKAYVTRGVRKREREVTIVLSDDETNENRPTSIKKSSRLGLSEAKGFNNEIFGKNTRDQKSGSEKRLLRTTRAKNPVGLMKRTVRLKNRMSKNMKKITA